jgi:hypothetical protein
MLNLYPEFLRPNIIPILQYLKQKKQKNYCHKVIIYTNNRGPNDWTHYIIKYFEKKINYKLFDQIITAFKINASHVEICRTSHLKTHGDLIKCTKIPANTQICFLDDVFYPGMKHDNIYYINIKPYIYDLTFIELIDRFIYSNMLDMTQEELALCKTYILNFLTKYMYNYVTKTQGLQNIDIILSTKILSHLHIFFNTSPPNVTDTKRKKITKNKNKTLKIKH